MALGDSTHLLINIAGASPELLDDIDVVMNLLDNLPKEVGMTLIVPAHVIRHTASNPVDSGLSGVSMLAESHVSIHCFPNRRFAHLDLFSCKSFDVNRAVRIIMETFDAKKHWMTVVGRDNLFDDFKPEAEIKVFKENE